jgi:tRNA(fMet)-specific endonuclease VapC
MVKKYLLDTVILIDLYKGNEKTKDIFDDIKIEECNICSVVMAEFFQGVYIGTKGGYEEKWYQDLIGGGLMSILPFAEQSAKIYAELQAKHIKKGQIRPILDLMIASVCLEYDLILVTKNIKDFEMIEGLKIFRR